MENQKLIEEIDNQIIKAEQMAIDLRTLKGMILGNTIKIAETLAPVPLEDSFKPLLKKYGKDLSQDIEKALRLETAHMTSGQWEKCNTAGMTAVNNSFPFGWSSLKEWADLLDLPPEAFSTMTFEKTSSGSPHNYVVFPTKNLFLQFWAWFIHNKRSGDITYWRGKSDELRNRYRNKLNGINARIV